MSVAGTLAQFRTVLGTIDVELYDQDKPATVQNFIRYVEAGLYQNIFLHRCVPGFVVQGGRYLALDTTDTNLVSTANIFQYNAFPPIINEFSVGRRLSNVAGTIAMARVGGITNSASSEWFFNLANNTGLDNVDGGFTVFGRVVRGTDVLNVFNQLDYNAGLVDLREYLGNTVFANRFTELPVFYLGAAPPRVRDLFFVDISLLNVHVKPAANRTQEISWRSVSGRTNRVEFTTSFPPSWNLLLATNGNGNRFVVTDSATNAPARFYRVRVDY